MPRSNQSAGFRSAGGGHGSHRLQQPKLLGSVRVGARRQHKERLRTVLDIERLAVERDLTEFGMDDRLLVSESFRDDVLGPE